MSDAPHRTRVRCSLLDRLTDEAPAQPRDGGERREVPVRELRRSVLRDLGWLLNSSGLGAVQDLAAYPRAAASVVNFGLPEMAGRCVSGLDMHEVEHRIRKAIRDFEPRILRESLEVRAWAADAAPEGNRLVFEVCGDLWCQPVPERLRVTAEIDLEGGEILVAEGGPTAAPAR
ncbi:MAG TPA: type VI secretion system baseplate subunit TssE [Burkholderiaceae bacterium]|nr:type VI secretion system baseplate subunit TssE [Burkholderiaceae bacterium]